MRHVLSRLILCALLVAVALLAPAPPARAGFLGRHTIFGKILRMTPLGRTVKIFEARQDAYRAADAWLKEARNDATLRTADLQNGLKSGKLDLRAYVHAQTTNLRHQQQYDDVAQRMKAIGHDNFNRALGQQALEHIMPRVVGSELFGKTVGEMKATLETGRKLLEEGVLDIQALANKAYPEFLRDGRRDIQDALQKLDNSGLSGGPVAEIRQRLQALEQGLGDLERRVPEMVKPDEVKQLQDEATSAAKTLGEMGAKLDAGVARLADKKTIYLQQRSVEKDVQIAGKLKGFAEDASMVQRAIGESQVRRALGPRLDEALARARLDRADPLYNKVRARALGMIDATKADELSDGELDAYCEIALREITEEADKPRVFGLATLAGTKDNLTPAYAPGYGWVKWEAFYNDTVPVQEERIWCGDFTPYAQVDDMTLSLVLNLDTDEMLSASWSGTASKQDASHGQGTATGWFEGGLYAGTVATHADGKGFTFSGQGWTRGGVEASVPCQGNTDEGKPREPAEGARAFANATHIYGKWDGGVGELLIEGIDGNNNLGVRIVIKDPPFVLESVDDD